MIPMTKKQQKFLLGHPMASLDNNGVFILIISDNGTYNWNGESDWMMGVLSTPLFPTQLCITKYFNYR